jgi:hypothetical protein
MRDRSDDDRLRPIALVRAARHASRVVVVAFRFDSDSIRRSIRFDSTRASDVSRSRSIDPTATRSIRRARSRSRDAVCGVGVAVGRRPRRRIQNMGVFLLQYV